MNNSCHYNEKRLSLQREKGITRNYSALSKLFEKTGDTPFVISYPSINETRTLKANSQRQKSHTQLTRNRNVLRIETKTRR